jgi:hypothetical protein
VEKGWLGRREEVSNRARWSSWYGGRGEEDVRYLREIWETRPGVGDGTLGASGRKKSLVMSRSARGGETNGLVQNGQTLLLS